MEKIDQIEKEEEEDPQLYVTIDGEIPKEPQSFIHSKKFLAISIPVGLLLAFAASWIMFF